jgi:diguanylate cyclase (GGDEF)-like protein
LLTARLLGDLRQQAATDPLTRLGHHASFTEAVDVAHRPHAPSQRPAVLVIDVDNFKLVNDEHGHPHGDRVLLDVVDEMGGALRDGDRLYRVGGDEFAAVLLVSEEAEAHAVAERLRSAVERGGHGTVSIGLAVGRSGDLAAATVQRADRALYEAKRSGRNGVVTASPA